MMKTKRYPYLYVYVLRVPEIFGTSLGSTYSSRLASDTPSCFSRVERAEPFSSLHILPSCKTDQASCSG